MQHEQRHRNLPSSEEERHIQAILPRRQADAFLSEPAGDESAGGGRLARRPRDTRLERFDNHLRAAARSPSAGERHLVEGSQRRRGARRWHAGSLQEQQDRRLHLRGFLRQRRQVEEEADDCQRGEQRPGDQKHLRQVEVRLHGMRQEVRDLEQLVQTQADAQEPGLPVGEEVHHLRQGLREHASAGDARLDPQAGAQVRGLR